MGLGSVELDRAADSTCDSCVTQYSEYGCLVRNLIVLALGRDGELELIGRIGLGTIDACDLAVSDRCGNVEGGIYGEGFAYCELLDLGGVVGFTMVTFSLSEVVVGFCVSG